MTEDDALHHELEGRERVSRLPSSTLPLTGGGLTR